MKKYEVCETVVNGFKRRVLMTSIVGLLILSALLVVDTPLYIKVVGAMIGAVVVVVAYYDLKNLKGAKEIGYSVNIENGELEYFNEFKGITKLFPREFKSLTIYKNNKKPNLLEFSSDKKKAVEIVYVIGLSKKDINNLIDDIKTMAPNLKIMDNIKNIK